MIRRNLQETIEAQLSRRDFQVQSCGLYARLGEWGMFRVAYRLAEVLQSHIEANRRDLRRLDSKG